MKDAQKNYLATAQALINRITREEIQEYHRLSEQTDTLSTLDRKIQQETVNNFNKQRHAIAKLHGSLQSITTAV